MGPFLVVEALWLFLPAYGANMAPVFAMRLFPHWNRPLDGGRAWRDGRPLLGPSKTWRGLVAGGLLGTLAAVGQSLAAQNVSGLSDFGYAASGSLVVPALLGLALGVGAILGDAAKSFFKRRTGRTSGRPWVPFDQLDFVVGALAAVALASVLLQTLGAASENWFAHEFLGPRWPVLLIVGLATPGLHFLVNVIGYRLKFKEVPW